MPLQLPIWLPCNFNFNLNVVEPLDTVLSWSCPHLPLVTFAWVVVCESFATLSRTLRPASQSQLFVGFRTQWCCPLHLSSEHFTLSYLSNKMRRSSRVPARLLENHALCFAPASSYHKRPGEKGYLWNHSFLNYLAIKPLNRKLEKKSQFPHTVCSKHWNAWHHTAEVTYSVLFIALYNALPTLFI